jgi:hypothetical protein
MDIGSDDRDGTTAQRSRSAVFAVALVQPARLSGRAMRDTIKLHCEIFSLNARRFSVKVATPHRRAYEKWRISDVKKETIRHGKLCPRAVQSIHCYLVPRRWL